MHLLFKGVVHPWHCDVMGHMNTRYYLAMFDDAGYQLLQEASGWTVMEDGWRDRGWADVHNSIDYLSELRAGDLVEIEGGISAIGNSSITAHYRMKNKVTENSVAKMTAKLIFFDLVARRSTHLTEELKQRMEGYWISSDIT